MNSQSEEVKELMSIFDTGDNEPFINRLNELILFPKFNFYFKLNDVKDKRDLKAKVIAWLSRPASKFNWYDEEIKNEEVRELILYLMNTYLGTLFTPSDMNLIYTKLGNDINRKLTYKFIDSGYDMRVLKDER